jgi:hypothetical protein
MNDCFVKGVAKMYKLLARLLLASILFSALNSALVVAAKQDQFGFAAQPEPSIEFTSVPKFGSFKLLKGIVAEVEPKDYRVAVYIFVGSGWWTKPFWSSPLTVISKDSTWSCDITTGGIDEQATKIKAFLVAKDYNPPLMSGNGTLPAELFENSVANTEAARAPKFRTISFSGYEWLVKTSVIRVGPGPNYFSDSAKHVWVDDQGYLHLRIKRRKGKWLCPEVISKRSFGYGRYIFHLASRVDQLDENVVLGLFTWDDSPEFEHREIDIEFSRWSQPNNENSQYVTQPYFRFGNIHRFDTQLRQVDSTHSFEWRENSIVFKSVQGVDIDSPDSGQLIDLWVYTGRDIPRPGNENARINLWLFGGNPPISDSSVEVIIKKFEFVP